MRCANTVILCGIFSSSWQCSQFQLQHQTLLNSYICYRFDILPSNSKQKIINCACNMANALNKTNMFFVAIVSTVWLYGSISVRRQLTMKKHCYIMLELKEVWMIPSNWWRHQCSHDERKSFLSAILEFWRRKFFIVD